MNGVEYNVNSSKLSGAIAELESVLNGLNSSAVAVLDQAILDLSILA